MIVLRQLWLKLSEGALPLTFRLANPAAVATLGLRTYARSTILDCSLAPDIRFGASSVGCILATVLPKTNVSVVPKKV